MEFSLGMGAGHVTAPTLMVMFARTASFALDVTSTTVRAEFTSVTSPTPAHDETGAKHEAILSRGIFITTLC